MITDFKKGMEKATEIISKYKEIVIFHHVRPDGDCLGSQFGLKDIINNNFKGKAYVAAGEYGAGFLEWMPQYKFDDLKKINKSEALCVVVDTAVDNRVDWGDENFKDYKEVLVIDHHPNNCTVEGATFVRIDSRPACCAIFGEWAYKEEFKLSKEGAEAIYLGIVTDTGRFQYRGVGIETHKAAAYLEKFKIDKEFMFGKLYERTTKDIEFTKMVFEKIQYNDSKDVAYVVIDKKMQDELELTPDECARVNTISGIKGVLSWNFFIEYPEFIRVEFRSRGHVECNQVAFKYGGGGHKPASGCHLKSFDQVKDVVKDLKLLIDKKLPPQAPQED